VEELIGAEWGSGEGGVVSLVARSRYDECRDPMEIMNPAVR